MKKVQLKKIVRQFPQKQILVFGDFILDQFIWGSVSRISPEAPVPVVEVQRETYLPGGAGNVVNNFSALGARGYLCAVVGTDPEADILLAQLKQENIVTEGILKDRDYSTILKTRIIAHHQQVVRVDREKKLDLTEKKQNFFLRYLESVLNKIDGIIISDYGKGMVNSRIIPKIIKLAAQARIPVLVDPKIEHFLYYKGVTALTPNQYEAFAGMRVLYREGPEEIIKLGQQILSRLRTDFLLITQGEKGMTIFERSGKITHLPTVAKEVFDVTGAGDTVISVLALALCCGADIRTAALLANQAAGIVVGKLGTATVTLDELLKEY